MSEFALLQSIQFSGGGWRKPLGPERALFFAYKHFVAIEPPHSGLFHHDANILVLVPPLPFFISIRTFQFVHLSGEFLLLGLQSSFHLLYVLGRRQGLWDNSSVYK